MLSLFLSLPPPPRSTLFPYTTLFRSTVGPDGRDAGLGRPAPRRHRPLPEPGRGAAVFAVQRRLLHRHARQGNGTANTARSEEHTFELQSQFHLVCRLLLEKKNT